MQKVNYDQEVFAMVNGYERQQAIKKKYRKIRKMKNLRIFKSAAVSGLISIIFGLLGVCGGMVGWIAYPVFSVAGAIALFMAGRWFEDGKHMR